MKTLVNTAKTRLEAGELSLGIGLRMARTVDIAMAMKTAGMDWLFIDMEHNSMGLDTGAQIAVTALDAGIAPLVRVPQRDFITANRMLDAGALGVVMPHVNSAAEARAFVDACRVTPLGHRGVSASMPQFDYNVTDLGAAMAALDEATLLVAMIEDEAAAEEADEIAATDGIDAILIGTNDLAASMGLPGDVGNDRVTEVYRKVGAACEKHAKWLGMGGVGKPELVERYIGMGARLILAGNDINYLIAGARKKTQDLRAIAL